VRSKAAQKQLAPTSLNRSCMVSEENKSECMARPLGQKSGRCTEVAVRGGLTVLCLKRKV